MASGLPKGPREPRPLGGVARAERTCATAPGCLPPTSRLWERSTLHPFWLSLWKGLRCPQPGAPTCPGRGPGEFPLRPTHVSLRTPPAHLAAGLGRVNRRPRRLRRPLHHATGRTVRSRCKFDLVLPVVVSSKTELLPWAADPPGLRAGRPALRGQTQPPRPCCWPCSPICFLRPRQLSLALLPVLTSRLHCRAPREPLPAPHPGEVSLR